jgi:hypothetical protein
MDSLSIGLVKTDKLRQVLLSKLGSAQCVSGSFNKLLQLSNTFTYTGSRTCVTIPQVFLSVTFHHACDQMCSELSRWYRFEFTMELATDQQTRVLILSALLCFPYDT